MSWEWSSSILSGKNVREIRSILARTELGVFKSPSPQLNAELQTCLFFMSTNHVAKSFPNQYKTFQWWIDGFGPAGGSFAAPPEWKSYAQIKRKMNPKIERNEERCCHLPGKAKLQSGSGASCVPPRTPMIDLSLTTSSFYLKYLLKKKGSQKKAGLNSKLNDTFKHTCNTWMTILQIHEYRIPLHKYGWFLCGCKLISSNMLRLL